MALRLSVGLSGIPSLRHASEAHAVVPVHDLVVWPGCFGSVDANEQHDSMDERSQTADDHRARARPLARLDEVLHDA